MRLETLTSRIFPLNLKGLGISQRTSIDFSLIFFANIINNATNFIANILVARTFGHEIFGLFSIAANIALTTLTLSEFGMNLTMVRLYKHHEEDPIKSKAILLWNLYFKFSVFIFLIMCAVICSQWLSALLMKRHDKFYLIAIALVTGGLLGFWSYFKALF